MLRYAYKLGADRAANDYLVKLSMHPALLSSLGMGVAGAAYGTLGAPSDPKEVRDTNRMGALRGALSGVGAGVGAYLGKRGLGGVGLLAGVPAGWFGTKKLLEEYYPKQPKMPYSAQQLSQARLAGY